MARAFSRASEEYLEVDSAPVTAAPLTMACWFNTTNTGSNQTLMQVGDSAGAVDYWQLAARGDVSGDPVRFVARRNSLDNLDTSTGYSSGVWHHACGVETSSTSRKVFIDAGSSVTGTTDLAPLSADRTSIGRAGDSTPGSHHGGKLAEAAIWSVALTDAEVAILALGFSPLFVRPASLVFYAPLIHGVTASGGNDIDIVGGLTLVDNNTVTVADHPRIIRPSRQLWTPFAAPAGNLEGSTTAVSTMSATILATGSLGGSTAGVSSAAGTMAGKTSLETVDTSLLISTLVGTLSGRGTLAGVTTGVGTPWVSSLFATGSLDGPLLGTSTITGSLLGQGPIDGSFNLTSVIAGTLVPSGSVGTLTALSSQSGTLLGTGVMSGPVAVVSTFSSTLVAVGSLAGSLAGSAVLAGPMLGNTSLEATLAVISDLSGPLLGRGAILATTNLTASFIGTLIQPPGPIDGNLTVSGSFTGTLKGQAPLVGTLTAISSFSATEQSTLNDDSLRRPWYQRGENSL